VFRLIFLLALSFPVNIDASILCPQLLKLVGKEIEMGLVWNGDGRIPSDVIFSSDYSRRQVFREFCTDCDYFYLGGSRVSDVYRVVDKATGRVAIFKHYFDETQAAVDSEALELLNQKNFKTFRAVRTLNEIGSWRVLENEFGLPLNMYWQDPKISAELKEESKRKFEIARTELDEWIPNILMTYRFKHPNQTHFFPRASNFLVGIKNRELILVDSN
jgi:hypothetical protein